jgi:two-component system OmpR family sensor kinase
MNLNSIFTKILFIYLVVITLFIAITFGYFSFANSVQEKEVKNFYRRISQYIMLNHLSPEKLVEYVESLGFKFEEKDMNHRFEKFPIIMSGPGFDAMSKDGVYYLNLHTPPEMFLFKDLNEYEKNYLGFWIIGFMFLIVSFAFLWIVKTLLPLKNLKEEIKEFANGNLQIDCKSNAKDEIADVANEFDRAVKEIALLLESRQLFLRTIMHELKTPIAKGKIVSSLIEDKIQKDRIITVFDKLNYLIDDFAKIEKVISNNTKLHRSKYSLGAILNSAVDMLMLENSEDKIIVGNISNKKLHVDIELFALAIKNLLDNALKYSTDKKAYVKEDDSGLYVVSKGEKLKKPLQDYYKPFHNDTKSKNHGMGLGLYIVYSILRIHDMSLAYDYKNQENIFKIVI